MKFMFLDQSGDHSLTKIDPQYPVFVVGGIVVESEYMGDALGPALRRFKRDLFGHEDVILHTAGIYRNRNGFERLKESRSRERSYAQRNELMRRLDYSVIACAIRKDIHLARYGAAAYDPYHLAVQVLVERFCMEIGDRRGEGLIVADRRGAVVDRLLRQEWTRLQAGGTRGQRSRSATEPSS